MLIIYSCICLFYYNNRDLTNASCFLYPYDKFPNMRITTAPV